MPSAPCTRTSPFKVYAATRNMGYNGAEVAIFLSLTPATVSQNIGKGKILIDRYEDLKDIGN
jgi:hypothetical protein